MAIGSITSRLPDPPGKRDIQIINEWIGIVSETRPQTDPRGLVVSTRGFVVTETGELKSEGQFWPVPVNIDGTLGGVIPYKINIRAAAIGGIAEANIIPFEGRLLYIVADVPPDGWASPPPGGVTETVTVILKTALRVDVYDTDCNYWPPRGGVHWVLAHEWNATYGPPWGKNGPLVNDVDLVLYDGKMFFLSYDKINTHPDPNEKENPSDPNSPVRKKGGLYCDYTPANPPGQPEDGPATTNSVIAYGSVIRLQSEKMFYPNTGGAHKDRLFISASDVPGFHRIRYANPGQAHKGGATGGWPDNNFLDVARWTGWTHTALISTSQALMIFTDPKGIWGLYGNSPSDWQLVKLADHGTIGKESVWVDPDNTIWFLDLEGGLWRFAQGHFTNVDRLQREYVDLSDLRGGASPPIGRIGLQIFRSGFPRSTLKGWRREGTITLDSEDRKWGNWGRMPIYVNDKGMISRSRYRFCRPLDQQAAAVVYDPSMDRTYLIGKYMQPRETPANQIHLLWYQDAARHFPGLPSNATRRNFTSNVQTMTSAIAQEWNQFTARSSRYAFDGTVPDMVFFVPWYFGSEFDFKRIHNIFVTASYDIPPLYSNVTPPSLQWYIRWKTNAGSSAMSDGYAISGDDMTPEELGWQALSLIDFDQDPETWVFNPNIPADGKRHRLGLIDERTGTPIGEFGRGVIAIQLACVYNGSDPALGITIREIAVEYEVLRQWP